MKTVNNEETAMRSEYDFSKGQRGRYVGRIKPGDTDPRNCKVSVTIHLDADIVQQLKQRATESGTAFEDQINNLLRDDIEPTEKRGVHTLLVDDDRFITAVAERVAEQLRQRE
jgi:uncharacterized protein (DUF4415 family)